MLFLDKEIKTWEQFLNVYKNQYLFKLYLISFNDLNELIENNNYKIKRKNGSKFILIPENDIKLNNKVKKNF